VARLGGDEFVVLLIDPDLRSAELVKTRLETCIAHFNAESRRPYRLSLSAGICASTAAPGRPRSLQAMVAAADAQMYQVKQERKRSGSGSLPAVAIDEQFSSGIWSAAPSAGTTGAEKIRGDRESR
jgi:diguanylate cyclase (GGDEF)-like protein